MDYWHCTIITHHTVIYCSTLYYCQIKVCMLACSRSITILMPYKFPDLWPDSTLGAAVQWQYRSKAWGSPARPAHGLLPSRCWPPVLCTESWKKALASLPFMAWPCPHHLPALLFLLLLWIYSWDSSAILVLWTKLLLPPSLWPSEWKPAMCGTCQPGTGVPARAVCSMAAAVERH